MLSPDLQATLQRAVADVRARRHEYLTLEHLLFAMLDDPTARDIIEKCGGDCAELKDALEVFFEDEVETLPDGASASPEQTLAFQRVFQRAAMHAQGSGRAELTTGNMLVAMFRETESHAVFLLEQQHITRLDVVSYISHGVSKTLAAQVRPRAKGVDEDAEGTNKTQDPLSAYCVDLTERARLGKIDPLVGRGSELERVVQVLARRRKNNPLLIGEPGVGKTALAEGLARRIVETSVPETLLGFTVFALDMTSVVAGTRFRGDFEERLGAIIKAVVAHGKAILFIDEIHNLIGAGATSGGSMDAANILKPALANGDLRCIGSTTFADFRQTFERDRGLARRFQRIDVMEPSVAETVEILRGLRSHYESHHGIRYSDAALTSAAELSARHITGQHLPDKAIDVIDEVGAKMRLMGQAERPAEILPEHVEVVVASIARIPTRTVSSTDKSKLASLEADLRRLIFGQDHAISQLAQAVKLSRAGLGHPNKPTGAYLFAGPTGVGKTELAKQLASSLGVEFIRFDMSEYMEKHTVSRLIGAPPGYVGFDQGGQLTDAVNKHPYSVVLLDEMEKAHPDVFNILLQVMDAATLTDNNGRKSDFRNVILIMTTNAGSREMSTARIGFGDSVGDAKEGRKEIERVFSPEFRNRLDAVVTFGALPPETIRRVVDKFLDELDGQLAEKLVDLHVSDAAKLWFAERGYDKAMGARPMGRLIQQTLKAPLANAILFGELVGGGIAYVDVEGGEVTVRCQAKSAADPVPIEA